MVIAGKVIELTSVSLLFEKAIGRKKAIQSCQSEKVGGPALFITLNRGRKSKADQSL